MAANETDRRVRELLNRREQIVREIPDLEHILRGSLRERFVRCGKPGCHCEEGKGHGPVRYLSVSLGPGRTRQITIAAEHFDAARQYVDNYERLKSSLEEISEINRELFQHRMLEPQPSPDGSLPPRDRRKRRR